LKKILPIGLLLVGIATFTVAFFIIKGLRAPGLEEDEVVAEIPLEKRPIVSLIPSEDGHWLTMSIKAIKVDNAYSLDYELLYKVSDGRTQGVPGSIELKGKTSIEREILLGSESSGKFRYDEGVEYGTLTLRFRNERGKLVGKLSTQFHLQSATPELISGDNEFSYTVNTVPKTGFFVIMETFGLQADAPGSLVAGPYGIFSSASVSYPGTVGMKGDKIFQWTASEWQELTSGKASNIGVFISTSE
jgi:hypothetical protein